jgi:hypothetical protein
MMQNTVVSGQLDKSAIVGTESIPEKVSITQNARVKKHRQPAGDPCYEKRTGRLLESPEQENSVP